MGLAAQVAVSNHYWLIDGQLETLSSPHRYLWPAELDLMAKIAGLDLARRWSSWERSESAEDAEARALADEAEEWLRIAQLDEQ